MAASLGTNTCSHRESTEDICRAAGWDRRRGASLAHVRKAVLAGLVAAVALAPAPPAAARSALSQPRLAASDLLYRGAFRLPAQVSDRKTFAYGGTALAYNPARNSLFAVGHDWYQLTAEVSIPRAVRAAKLHDLHRARFLQGFADATDGTIDQTGGTGSNKIGGQLVYR